MQSARNGVANMVLRVSFSLTGRKFYFVSPFNFVNLLSVQMTAKFLL